MKRYDPALSVNGVGVPSVPATAHSGNPDNKPSCASDLYPEFYADHQEEICNAIEGAGISLDGTKRNQLLLAIQTIAAASGGGGGGGGMIVFDKATLASGGATVGFTPLAIGTPPVGANGIYLSCELSAENDGTTYQLVVKDTQGVEHRFCLVDGAGTTGSTYGSDRSTAFIDLSGLNPVEYKVERTAGSGVLRSWTIEKWGWSIPARDAASLETLELNNQSESQSSTTSKTANIGLTSQLLNVDRIEGSVNAVVGSANSYPIDVEYVFAKIAGTWYWTINGIGTVGGAGTGSSASASGTGLVATLPELTMSAISGNKANITVTIADYSVSSTLSMPSANSVTLDATAAVSALANSAFKFSGAAVLASGTGNDSGTIVLPAPYNEAKQVQLVLKAQTDDAASIDNLTIDIECGSDDYGTPLTLRYDNGADSAKANSTVLQIDTRTTKSITYDVNIGAGTPVNPSWSIEVLGYK